MEGLGNQCLSIENLSYEKFVTHQLAGDLISNADQSTKIATAFNRLHKKKF